MRRTHLWGIGMFLLVAAAALPLRAQSGFVLFPNAPQLALCSDGKCDASMTGDATFVHPVTDPFFHEDSFVGTDIRLWYAYNWFSDRSPVFAGGDAQEMAAQLRVALTNQLQFVAYKDGFQELHPDHSASDGWNDVAAGIKWEFLQDHKDNLFAAFGVGYQFPWGESKVLQNKEELRLWTSLDKGFDKLHVGGTFNYFIATGEKGLGGTGDRMDLDLHADYRVCNFFSPVVEASYIHVTHTHDAVLPIQGADVTNLGGGYKDDVLTLSIGAEVRPLKNLAVRAAWEKNILHPSTDIEDNRLTVSAVISF